MVVILGWIDLEEGTEFFASVALEVGDCVELFAPIISTVD